MPEKALKTLEENLARVRERIRAAARAAGRVPDDIHLLAASKGAPPAAVRQAADAGQRLFGESYLQEALGKRAALHGMEGLEWHFIGPVQRNKTRDIAAHFHWLHSLDRAVIAERLAQQRGALPPLNVLIQVNISREPSKSGLRADDMMPLADRIIQLPSLCLRGLMALPAPDPRRSAAEFAAMYALFHALQNRYPGQKIDTLSMGMSDDLEAAIMAGATLIRVGTAIFGPRAHPRSATDARPAGEKDVQ